MSDDDVVRLEDFGEWLAPDDAVGPSAGSAVAVALTVLAVGLTLGVLVHTPLAVTPEVADEDGFERSDRERAVQFNRNSWVWWFERISPGALAAVAAPVAFVAARGDRGVETVAVALAGGVGAALGYAAFVGVGHLAYAPTEQGVFVERPARLAVGAVAGNAVLVAVAGTVAAALAALARSAVDEDEPDRDVADSRSAAPEDA